jgi:hypothetical protein
MSDHPTAASGEQEGGGKRMINLFERFFHF